MATDITVPDTETTFDPSAVRRHRGLFRLVERSRRPRLRRCDVTVTDEKAVRQAVKAAALGNAMEWFDFGLYGYLAVTLGKVFFPSGSPTAQTLASLGAFAAAFVLRPIGGFVFGPLGDRIGRRKILAFTMVMMAAGTCAIGLIPSYAAIGMWAPMLLLALRVLQGFSTGGEYGGAATFIAEYAPDKKRGFFGSFLEFGTLAGYVAASGLVTVLSTTLSDASMLSWGWRLPFLVAGPLGMVGMYMRLKLEDTPAFRKLEQDVAACEPGGGARPSVPLVRLITSQWRALVLCLVLVAAYDIADYMLLSYLPTYLTQQLHYGTTDGLLVLVVVMVVLMCLVHPVGKLSDRVGRRPVLMTGMVGFVVLSVPSFMLIRQGSTVAVYAGVMLLGLCLLTFLAAMSAALPALFPTEVRYGSLAIGFNVAGSLFGGTTPLVAAALISVTGNNLMPGVYMAAAAAVGIVAVLCMQETARKPLAGSPPAVSTPEEAAALVSEYYAGQKPFTYRESDSDELVAAR